MCDYSLQHVPSRPAKVDAEQLDGTELWRQLKKREFRVVTEWASRRWRAERADGALSRTPSSRTIARLMTIGRDGLCKAETVTVSELVSRVRRDLADDWLQRTDFNVKHISYLLGYSDAAAFSRAYKRWTGRSPAGRATKRAATVTPNGVEVTYVSLIRRHQRRLPPEGPPRSR
jgi:AraC-like DNA-binding protein